MDFDIGNILYIVITIVAVTVGLLGKKKKPADGGSGAEGNDARPSFMQNLERVLQMGQEPQEVQYIHESEEDLPAEEIVEVQAVEGALSDVRSRPSIMDEYDRIMNRSTDGESNLTMSEGESMNEVLEVVDLDELAGTDYFEIIKDFDAGTAIVYASIINRLDY